jgi:transposase
VGACRQRARPRGAGLSPHRGPPPFCPHIEAELDAVVRAARCAAATPPVAGVNPAPRWTLRRLVSWGRERFGLRYCRETIRAALHRLDLSRKKAKKLLGRADPAQRQAFVDRIRGLLAGAQRDRCLLVSWDEAHIRQDADPGSGWSPRGQRFWVVSRAPGLSAKLSFYGLYLDNEGAVRLWPYPRANGLHPSDALHRLRAEWPESPIIVVRDGAPSHRAACVHKAATALLRIDLVRLPGYSRDFMPVEELWRWLREDVTCHYCHPTSDDLRRRVDEFEADINQDPYAVADRLVVKDRLDPEEEKRRFSN